jgi:hypothetical protein
MQATIEKGDRCEVGCMPQRPLGRVGQILFERNLGSKHRTDAEASAHIRGHCGRGNHRSGDVRVGTEGPTAEPNFDKKES